MRDRITFDPATHLYYVDGSRAPGVTDILKATGFANGYAAIPVGILEAARERGIQVHRFCEQLDRGEDFIAPAKLQPYVDAYDTFREQADQLASDAGIGADLASVGEADLVEYGKRLKQAIEERADA